MTKKKLLSQASAEARTKDVSPHSVNEVGPQLTHDVMDQLEIAVERGKKQFPDQDFFVQVVLKREKFAPINNTIRPYYVPRQSCPTPDYDQQVYMFDSKSREVLFVWVVPDRESCYYFLHNKDKVVKEERELLQFVLDYADGTLMKMAKVLNGESLDKTEYDVLLEIGDGRNNEH